MQCRRQNPGSFIGRVADESEVGQATAALRKLVDRIPQWVRDDLNAADPIFPERAEHTLDAMIAALVGRGLS
jgi:hypothetical protein